MILIGLLILMVLAALWAVMTNLLLRAAIALSLVSALLTVVMFQLGAPYAAVFELSVCAGLIPVIFISVISLLQRLPFKEQIQRRQERIKRFWSLPLLLLVIGVALSLVRLPLEVPLPWRETIGDVRVVLWEYKRFDLFGQVLALLAGAYGILIFFRSEKNDR
jgi:NADH-quinone oxidoreductase subunit J